jgi:hypothetical protein
VFSVGVRASIFFIEQAVGRCHLVLTESRLEQFDRLEHIGIKKMAQIVSVYN